MVAIGANQSPFHLEDTKNPGTLIKDTWENEMKVRLAIKLGTTVEYLAPCANQIDTISFMPVQPEFGGQKFMGDTMSMVHQGKTQCPSLDIEVSAEVGTTRSMTADMGANMSVSGRAIMRSEHPRSVIDLLRYWLRSGSETFFSSARS